MLRAWRLQRPGQCGHLAMRLGAVAWLSGVRSARRLDLAVRVWNPLDLVGGIRLKVYFLAPLETHG